MAEKSYWTGCIYFVIVYLNEIVKTFFSVVGFHYNTLYIDIVIYFLSNNIFKTKTANQVFWSRVQRIGFKNKLGK